MQRTSLEMSNTPLEHQFAFLIEADALKSVQRQSLIADRSRRENSAEHSWHLALFALVLGEDRPSVNTGRVISMLLLHDLVEIDVGDTPIHSPTSRADVAEAEATAAKRIFGLLPEKEAQRFLSLWEEFERAETPDAQFAKALDRLQPLLLNTLTAGGTWAQNNVTEDQVYSRYGPVIERGAPDCWAYARTLVRQHFESQQSK